MPGFPSLFVMYGPIFYLERQAAYLRRAPAAVRERGAAAIEVRPEVEQASDATLQARFAGTAWTRCDSRYRDESGRIVTDRPGYMRDYAKATETLDPSEHVFLS